MKRTWVSCNMALLNYANYEDKHVLKKLLRAFPALYLAALRGDVVAAGIYVDLKDALLTEGVLSASQRLCVFECVVKGHIETETADKMGIAQQTVSRHTRAGLKNIQKYLTA